MLVFSLILLTYFAVVSGLVYDVIVEPPGIGSSQDPATGAVRPVVFLPGRVNGQYIIEGLSSGFMFLLGGVGIILLDLAVDRTRPRSLRVSFGGAGVAAIVIAYAMAMLFLRIKIPGYLWDQCCLFGRAVAARLTVCCRAAGKGEEKEVVNGVMFQPFEELKGELSLVPQAKDQSLARHKFVDDCEAALNEQINVEYNASYAYHSLFAYFDRDNVALKGFAKFFKESSEEERGHAEKLMEYQNKRGGRVRLQSIVTPLTEFDHPEKGDALYAMELALALERLVNEKLHNLHSVATRCNDPQLTNTVESEFLQEQVEAIKKISGYVSQLRRVGKGHGVWHFDRMLLEEAA